MANIDDFGISVSDIQKRMNPRKDPRGINLAYWDSGVTGTVSEATFTVSGETWTENEWEDFYLYFTSTGNLNLISSNTKTVITCSTNISGSGAWQIRAKRLYLTTTDIESIIAQRVAWIKSRLPEKYRVLLCEITETIVTQALDDQSTATIAFTPSDTDKLFIYRNPPSMYLDDEFRLDEGTVDNGKDYEISSKTITFHLSGGETSYLTEGDVIVAKYPHTLDTVPTVLKEMGICAAVGAIYDAISLQREIGEGVANMADKVDKWLADLQAGRAGIEAFDKLVLAQIESKQGYSSGQIYRG